jgi:hypothetical protein
MFHGSGCFMGRFSRKESPWSPKAQNIKIESSPLLFSQKIFEKVLTKIKIYCILCFEATETAVTGW